MILIAVGGNLPGNDGTTPLATCAAAVAELRDLPGMRFEALSRWYRTAPVPPSGQPDYINGVARFARLAGALLTPEALLAAAQTIEARFGRVRAERDAARTLDLDIVDIDGLVRTTPDPILPHPRAHLRAFVLLPLRDVAPDWVHPVSGQTLARLLSTVDRSGVTPISA